MAAAASTRAPQEHPIAVLYASQTGTAQDVAERIGREAGRRGFLPTVSSMDAFPLAKLPSAGMAILVAATTGDGDPPDNMKAFWNFLLRKDLPSTALGALKFSVFGLGDSGYAKFNSVARKLQRRFLQLGATEFCPRGLGDDQSEPLGMDGDLEEWLSAMWPAALALHPLPKGCSVDDAPELLRCRYMLSVATEAPIAPAPRHTLVSPPTDALAGAAGAAPVFLATVLSNERLTAEDWSQDVRHVEFDISTAPVQYSAGDIASVWPENPQDLVARLLARLGLDGSLCVSVGAATAPGTLGLNCSQQGTMVPTSAQHRLPQAVSLQDLFRLHLDIGGVPRRSVFEQLSFFAEGEEADKLREISAPGGADLYASYVKKERRNIVEVLEDFTTLTLPLAFLLELLPPLTPRHFSIASGPSAAPGRLQLCVAVVDFTTPFKRRIRGLASTYIAALQPGAQVTMALRPGTLRVPPAYLSSTGTPAPLILIGPGTGVAPMRGLVQELEAALPDGQDAPSSWQTHLYFGCRKQSKDFLYAAEWEAAVKRGVLSSVRPAFSRDGPTKVYVQRKLWEDKEALGAALRMDDSRLYIAGSAKRMPADVLDILETVLTATGSSAADSKALLGTMTRQGRLVVEAWS